MPKTPALDEVCVGDVEAVEGRRKPTFSIKCTGRGSYQRTRLDKFGFPRDYLMRQKFIKGFQTGDMVPSGVKAGKYFGR